MCQIDAQAKPASSSGLKIGFFEIARESADIPFDDFWYRYFVPERPVIIEKVGQDWPARALWREDYLHDKLSREPSAKTAVLWYRMARGALSEDYETPAIVEALLDSPHLLARDDVMRIWMHPEGNVSSWHYDANIVNVFNVQVTGQKEWFLISPETPLCCYPFTNYAIMDNDEDNLLNNKCYTRFLLNEGDMLFIPALWFHKVVARGEENINLNWVLTKKETSQVSRTLLREVDRYRLQAYFSTHPVKPVRAVFKWIFSKLPAFIRWKWRYSEMIKTPLPTRKFAILRFIFRETTVLGKVLLHADKIKPYMNNLNVVRKFE